MGSHISQQQWSFLRKISDLDRKDGVPIGELMLEMDCFTPEVIQTLAREKRIEELRQPIDGWIKTFVDCGFVEDMGGRLHVTELGHNMAKRVR